MNNEELENAILDLAAEGTKLAGSVLRLINNIETLNERLTICAIKVKALEGLAGIGDLG